MTYRRQPGFTLIELMITIVIIAMLLMLTLPVYQQQLRSTRRGLGIAALLETMMRQEQYFIDHKRYADDLSALGFPSNPYALDDQGNAATADTHNRIYLVSLATRTGNVTLFAAPQLSQALDLVCGTMSLDSTGVKQVSGRGTVSECW